GELVGERAAAGRIPSLHCFDDGAVHAQVDDGGQRREAEGAYGDQVGVEERQYVIGQVAEEGAGLSGVAGDQPGDPAVGVVVGGVNASGGVEDPAAALVRRVEGD